MSSLDAKRSKPDDNPTRENWHLVSERKRQLIIAVSKGDVEMAKAYLRKEDLGEPCALYEGMHFLMVACQNKTTTVYGMLEWLVKHPDDLMTLRDENGLTPLMYGAYHHNIEAMKAWIKLFPFSIIQQSFSGSSAMTYAAASGFLEGFKLLRNHLANPDDPGANGATPLLLVCAHDKNIEMVKYILSECSVDVDKPDHDGRAPIHAVAKNGNLEILELLLNKGVNVNSITRESVSPLMIATTFGHRRMVQYLLREFSDTELSNRQGKTALALAAEYGETKILKDLLNAGANPSPLSMEEGSPLIMAAQEGHLGCIKLIASSSGVDVRRRDKRGRSAFDMAAARGNYAVLRYLVQKGAKGNTPEQKANWAETVNLMEDTGRSLEQIAAARGEKLKEDDEEAVEKGTAATS